MPNSDASVHRIEPRPGPELGVKCDPGRDCSLNGLTGVGAPDAFISGAAAASIRYVTAYELGHSLNVIDPGHPNPVELMHIPYDPAKSPAEPCQVKRVDWKLVNPTVGDDQNAK